MTFPENGAFQSILKRVRFVGVTQDLAVLLFSGAHEQHSPSSAQLLLWCTHYSSPSCSLDRK